MKIYAFSTPAYKGYLKIGQTTREVEQRIDEIMSSFPKCGKQKAYKVELEIECNLTDHQVHKELEKRGFQRDSAEWFKCERKDVVLAIASLLEVPVRLDTEYTAKEVEALLVRIKLWNSSQIKTLSKLVNANLVEELKKLDTLLSSSVQLENTLLMMNDARKTFGMSISEVLALIKDPSILIDSIGRVKEDFNSLGIKNLSQFREVESTTKKLQKLKNVDGWDLSLSEEDINKRLKEFKTIYNEEGFKTYKDVNTFIRRFNSLQDFVEDPYEFIKEYKEEVAEIASLGVSPSEAIGALKAYNESKDYIEGSKKDLEEIKILMQSLGISSINEISSVRKNLEETVLIPILEDYLNVSYYDEEDVLRRASSFEVNFGKHKGEMLIDVFTRDNQYFNWILTQYVSLVLSALVIRRKPMKQERKKQKKKKEDNEITMCTDSSLERQLLEKLAVIY